MSNISLSNLTAKQKRTLYTGVRSLIQVIFFLFFPSVYTAAFAGIKYIFAQIGNGELIEFTSFVTVLVMMCIYTILFGRFFCGFACAFGTLGDAVYAVYVWICKKIKKKPLTINETIAEKLAYLKYVVLMICILLSFAGIYSKTQGMSPWDVFSMLRAGNFDLGNYIPGTIVLLLLLVGMCIQERFFCRFLCPMGAVFSLLPVLPFFSLSRNAEGCIKGCKACSRKCPAGIRLPADDEKAVMGECFQCQKCVTACSRSNIHCGIGIIRGNEIWFTILRAAALAGLFIWLGI